MELDKIKIYATKRVADILQKDAETFEFLKTDGYTPNKNAFLSALVINYWDTFKTQQEFLNDSIYTIIKQNSFLPEERIHQICGLITNKVNREQASDTVEKFDNLISFKPTKSTIEIIDYINQFLLENCSLSEYFRNMFTAYTSLPQDMREKIIFKQNYQLISDAINRKKQIFISVQGAKRTTMQIAPYSFSRSKEEIHIYLIYKAEQSCKSIKLSKIQSVTVLDKNAKFNELDIKLIEKMQKYGAQFSYDYNEEPIVVKLTPRGQLLLHKIYVHRPIPDKIDGNIYTFNCSHQQVIQYFLRFGGEVEIIAPVSVRREMYDFHNSYIKRTKN